MQGIYDPIKNVFKIFEAGLRCAGEAPYRFTKFINDSSFYNIILDYSLTNKTNYDLSKENPLLKGKYCGIISFVGKHGKIKEITGINKTLKSLTCIKDFEQRYRIGDEIPDTNTLKQIIMRFVLVCDSKQELIESINYINNNINIIDMNNEDITLKFDSTCLIKSNDVQ